MNETGLVDPQELGIKDAVQDEDAVIAVDADAQTGEVTATTGDETAVVDGGEGQSEGEDATEKAPVRGHSTESQSDNDNASQTTEQQFATAEEFADEASALADLFLAERETQTQIFEEIKKQANGEPLQLEQLEPILQVLDNIIENVDQMEAEFAVHSHDIGAQISFGVLEAVKADAMLLKKDIVTNMDMTSGIMKSESKSQLNSLIDAWAGEDDEKKEQAERIKNTISNIEAAVGIAFDRFAQLNKLNSFDEFLSFVMDPVGASSGREFNFGSTEFGDRSADIVVLHQFKAKFRKPLEVGQALVRSMSKLQLGDWASEHLADLNAVASEEDPETTHRLLVDIYNKFLNTSEGAEKWTTFRLEFTTELFGGESDKYADDDCEVFLDEMLRDEGEKLKTFWNM